MHSLEDCGPFAPVSLIAKLPGGQALAAVQQLARNTRDQTLERVLAERGAISSWGKTHLQPPFPQGSEPRVSEPTGSEPRVSEPLVSEPL